jgi:hypothetical protein
MVSKQNGCQEESDRRGNPLPAIVASQSAFLAKVPSGEHDSESDQL